MADRLISENEILAYADVMCKGVSCVDCPFCVSTVYGGCKVWRFVKSLPTIEPKHGRCNTCRYMTKDELCTRYDDENGTHSTMPEGYCWLWERRKDEVEE